MLRASVCVATWRRRESLRALLESLEQQSMDPAEYELIVCDSHSDDGTQEVVAAVARRFGSVHYVHASVNALAAKRNLGLTVARAPVAIFLDDDVVADRSLIERHVVFHESCSWSVACGQVRYPPEWVGRSGYCRFRDSRLLGGPGRTRATAELPYYLIVMMNLSLKPAEVLGRVGYVSEEFRRYGCEDQEFGYRLTKAGFRLLYNERALVYHREEGGNAMLYLKKLSVAARDSVPVLHRLAPETAALMPYRLLERPKRGDGLRTRVAKLILSMATPQWAANGAASLLVASDRTKWLYIPHLYLYLALAGYRLGAWQRGPQEKEAGSLNRGMLD